MILLTSVSALGMNLFLPSLPGMAEFFDAPYEVIQLSVAGYLGVNALLQIIIGPLSDQFGRRRVMLGATAIFVVATIGCLFSTNVWVFLTFRMIQAAIVAGLVLPRAAIRDLYTQDESASMMGYVTMGMSLAPMLAPALGGVLDQAFGWHASFVVYLLVGIGAFALTYYDMGETAAAATSNFRGQLKAYPELLTSPRFWGYAATAAFSSGAFFAYLGGAPYVGSEVFQLSPSVLGIYFGAPAVGYFVGNFITARFSVRMGTNRMVLYGSVVSAIGLGTACLLSLADLESPAVFFGFMTFVGLGNGLVIPNATAGMLSVRPHLAGTASGLGGAIMIGGGAALSVLAGILLAGQSSALPLTALMTFSSILAVAAILFVLRREARLRARG
ncbi:MFS transporter, DHA1 family, bicyclomycin/chloramphenicol resistance protein [Palleronia marisminoris]|uniref:Bcr/CflA family efflux transporter n=1 Tax=Palleronia marisminoris TaxID=315423 RepID=A0A1Y5RW58_9RHOB|nr:multidrug effflux MFS transporter [Palleronia marisminoris]SFG51592.1 MFS transporter, DHA1 family, bicyclomycin/chloramphenicol resistance protein [Palleronia marisminoris]SLN24251.1 Bicyclomycin resistance protein [Palleronia marisminoris]